MRVFLRGFGVENERHAVAIESLLNLLSATEWVTHEAVIAGLAGMDDDHAYRAMDLLVDADTTGRVQEAVFFAVANLLNLEVDLLFFDTASTYFERDTEDDGADAFRLGLFDQYRRAFGPTASEPRLEAGDRAAAPLLRCGLASKSVAAGERVTGLYSAGRVSPCPWA
jgi:hypothetical protein